MKKSEQIEDAIIRLIEGGLSMSRAAQSLGLHHKTPHRWKEEDQDFADRVAQAESKFIAKMIGNVATQAEKDWRAAIELLARRFPEEFAKPEARLAVTQVNVQAKAETGKQTLERLAQSPKYVDYVGKLHRRLMNQQAESGAVTLAVDAEEEI